MVGVRRKKPYLEERIFIPITREPEPCIEDKCNQWDLGQNKCKLIVCERKI